MRALVCVPSVSDVVGAGGVAPRWRGYVGELEAAGWAVELWCVDSADAQRRIPRCVHPFFPLTLTDLPSVPWMWALRRALRSRRPDVVVVTDLFNDVPVALLAAACAVPLAYSLHTDGSKLPGGVPALASLSQAVTSRLAARRRRRALRASSSSAASARPAVSTGTVPSPATTSFLRRRLQKPSPTRAQSCWAAAPLAKTGASRRTSGDGARRSASTSSCAAAKRRRKAGR